MSKPREKSSGEKKWRRRVLTSGRRFRSPTRPKRRRSTTTQTRANAPSPRARAATSDRHSHRRRARLSSALFVRLRATCKQARASTRIALAATSDGSGMDVRRRRRRRAPSARLFARRSERSTRGCVRVLALACCRLSRLPVSAAARRRRCCRRRRRNADSPKPNTRNAHAPPPPPPPPSPIDRSLVRRTLTPPPPSPTCEVHSQRAHSIASYSLSRGRARALFCGSRAPPSQVLPPPALAIVAWRRSATHVFARI